jgi:hypothetical protein
VRVGQQRGIERERIESADPAVLDELRSELDGLHGLLVLDAEDDGATMEKAAALALSGTELPLNVNEQRRTYFAREIANRQSCLLLRAVSCVHTGRVPKGEEAMDIVIPELDMLDLELFPETRAVKKGEAPSKVPLDGWVSLGRPQVLALRPQEMTDPSLKLALEAQQDRVAHFLVHLACTFKAPEDARLDNAWLEVLLACEDPQAPPPIAWSMAPKVERETATLKTSLELKPSFKGYGVELSLGGISSETNRETQAEVHLEALNELQSNPTWEFTKTPHRAIRGVHRLELIVQAPRRHRCTGAVSLRASVSRKGWVPWTYQTSMTDRIGVSFAL